MKNIIQIRYFIFISNSKFSTYSRSRNLHENMYNVLLKQLKY